MKNFYHFLILLSFTFGNAQVKLNQYQEKKLSLQIRNVEQLFMTQDYISLANNVSPKVTKLLYNSKDSVTVVFKFLFDEIKKKGVTATQITLGTHSKVYKTKNELQCSVPMTTILKKDSIKSVSEAFLLMVSNHDGEKWYFSITDGYYKSILDIHPKLIVSDRKLSVYENGKLIRNE